MWRVPRAQPCAPRRTWRDEWLLADPGRRRRQARYLNLRNLLPFRAARVEIHCGARSARDMRACRHFAMLAASCRGGSRNLRIKSHAHSGPSV